jgi:hypothetical protein
LIEPELPIYSLRWRRITLIETSWNRFSAAEEISDLYASGADGLLVTLKEEGFWPEWEFEGWDRSEVLTCAQASAILVIGQTDRMPRG